MTVLIFPANPVEAQVYARQLKRAKTAYIGASSILQQPILKASFDPLFYLPHLMDPDFWPCLHSLIETQAITELATPHSIIYQHYQHHFGSQIKLTFLDSSRQQSNLLAICNEYVEHWVKHRPMVNNGRVSVLELPDSQSMTLFLYHAMCITGQSSPEKLLNLSQIFASAVKGDIIEIGVMQGRSLWMLTALARYYQTGQVLGVDPWAKTKYKQGHPVVDIGSSQPPPTDRYAQTCANLWPDFEGSLNLLASPSIEAAQHYYAEKSVTQPLFGKTDYQGKIAILHIDGNHAYESVQADIKAWEPALTSGAWVLFDDYVWHFGDGPQRAADEWLHANKECIANAFVLAEMLFVKLH